MRRTLLVLASVAILVVAMAAPAFAGLKKGQNDTNLGFTQNDFPSPANPMGTLNGGDVNNSDSGASVGDPNN